MEQEQKDLKRRRPLINVSDEDLKTLIEIANAYNTSAQRIIEQFIFDLTASEYSGGSDERDLASGWLERSRYNF